MKTQTLLQIGSIILQERALETKLRALQGKRRGLAARTGSSGMSRGTERVDLSLDIALADYLALFADKDPKPTAGSYESDHHESINGELVVTARGVKHYMTYPAQFVGTLPTKPPTHIWATASTDSAWAAGDPKPIVTVKPEAVAA